MTTSVHDPWGSPVDVVTASQLNAFGIRVSLDPRRGLYRLRCGELRASVTRQEVVGRDMVAVFKEALGSRL